MLTASTYWLAFSVSFPTAVAATDITNLGAVKFNQYKGDSLIKLALTGDFTGGNSLTKDTTYIVNEEFNDGYVETNQTDVVGFN